MMISDAASTSAESRFRSKRYNEPCGTVRGFGPTYAASCIDGTVNSFVTGISVVFSVHPAQRAGW